MLTRVDSFLWTQSSSRLKSLDKADYEALVSGKPVDSPNGDNDHRPDTPGNTGIEDDISAEPHKGTHGKQHVQEIGKSVKKRKAIKVGVDGLGDAEDEPNKNAPTKKAKKKTKSVKLSFGDD